MLLLIVVAAVFSVLSSAGAGEVRRGIAYQVNSIQDHSDASPGDGICEDVRGYCTLRAALEESNLAQARNVIRIEKRLMNSTFFPRTALPEIKKPLVLETSGIFRIDGRFAGPADGLLIRADHCVIRGVAVSSFAGAGFRIHRFASGNIISNTRIEENAGHGIFLKNAFGTQILKCRIFRNAGSGIFINGSEAGWNSIRNCLIAENKQAGIRIQNASENRIEAGNQISRNGFGILITGISTGNTVPH